MNSGFRQTAEALRPVDATGKLMEILAILRAGILMLVPDPPVRGRCGHDVHGFDRFQLFRWCGRIIARYQRSRRVRS